MQVQADSLAGGHRREGYKREKGGKVDDPGKVMLQ